MRRPGENSSPTDANADAKPESGNNLGKEITIQDWRDFTVRSKSELPSEFDNGFAIVGEKHGIQDLNPAAREYFENDESIDRKQPDGSEKVHDFSIRGGRYLGQGFDKACETGDFRDFNMQLSLHFHHAYRLGGMDAVRKLEYQIHENTRDGAGPVVFSSQKMHKVRYNLTGPAVDVPYLDLRILNVEKVSREQSERAIKMTEQELKETGLVHHPNAGWMRILNPGTSLSFDPEWQKRTPDAYRSPKPQVERRSTNAA